MYVDIITRDNAQNMKLCDELYKRREQDVQEKADLFERLGSRISELEKKEAASQRNNYWLLLVIYRDYWTAEICL